MTSLFPYLILAVLFVRGITLEGSVQGIIYYLKPEFSQTPLCTGQSSSTISSQSSTDSSLLRSVIIYYLKPEFHRLLSAQVSHTLLPHTLVPQTPLCTGQLSSTTVSNHYLHETETHFYTDWSSSTQTRVP